MPDYRDDLFAQIVSDPHVDPRPLYHQMREAGPVYRTPLGIWWVLSYDLARQLLTDRATWTVDPRASEIGDVRNADTFVARTWSRSIINRDGADHDRLHGIVKGVFRPQAIRTMREHIEYTVSQEVAKIVDRTEFDLRWDFAEHLPTRIILELLGIDQGHVELFAQVAESLAQVREPTATRDTLEWGDGIWRRAAAIVEEAAEERRRAPGEDLLSALVAAKASGDRLTQEELVSMVLVLAVAGQETTGQLMCSGFFHLLTSPGQMDLVRADRALVPRAIEEALRFDTPTRVSTARYAAEQVNLGGASIGAGEAVMACLSAANVDEAVFENPLTFDLRRSATRHLGFGSGHHHCLGSALARLEVESVWNALLDAFADVEVEPDLPWKPRYLVRGLQSMPIRVVRSEVLCSS